MALMKMVNGVSVEMPPDEEATFLAEQTENAGRITVPRSLTRRKALQQLLIEGYSQADIEALIPQLPCSELEKCLALIEFQESLEFERYRPLTVQMAVLMGKDGAWLDRVFIDGDKLP